MGPAKLVTALAPPDAEQEPRSLTLRIALGLNLRQTDLPPPHPCAHPDSERQKRYKVDRERYERMHSTSFRRVAGHRATRRSGTRLARCVVSSEKRGHHAGTFSTYWRIQV